MAYTWNNALDAGSNYNAWVAAGKPPTDQYGNQLDVRGQPMSMTQNSNQFIQSPPSLSSTPVTGAGVGNGTPWMQNAQGTWLGGYVPGQTAQSGIATKPGLPTGNATPGQYGGAGVPPTTPVGTQTPMQLANGGGVAATPTPATTPTDSTTLGALATGTPPTGGIPAAPGNPYTLNIDSYLNPMLAYGLKSGADTIANSAAASGNLNSGDTLKQLEAYGMSQGLGSFNNAANIAAGQQNFAYGVDNNDRNFAYNAQTGDRNFDAQIAMELAGLGSNAVGNQSTVATNLARILSNNGILAGQAQGQGTTGSGNILIQAILAALNGGH